MAEVSESVGGGLLNAPSLAHVVTPAGVGIQVQGGSRIPPPSVFTPQVPRETSENQSKVLKENLTSVAKNKITVGKIWLCSNTWAPT